MNRRTYIYCATPLLVLLSCGQMLENLLGATWALVLAGVVMLVVWGLVWMRLYKMEGLRPEFAVLSILPHSIYFFAQQFGTEFIAQSAALRNLYFLSWLGFAGVAIASVRPSAGDTPTPRKKNDAVFLLMAPLICLYSLYTFVQYYTSLTSL